MNQYEGFTHFSRMDYSDIPHLEFVDDITFGTYVRNDGCISEASVRWEILGGKTVPRLMAYDDGLEAAYSPKFLAVVENLKKMGSYTPEQLSELLVVYGYEDNSDRPLQKTDKIVRLQLPADTIEKYEKSLHGHIDPADFSPNTLVEKWRVAFDVLCYEMEIHVRSGGCDEPFWCDAFLFRKGEPCACTDPTSKLQGEWSLTCDGIKFTVIVEPERKR